MGISAGSLSDYLQTDIVSRKYRLLFASAEEALTKSFLEALKREGNSLRDLFIYCEFTKNCLLMLSLR